MIPAHSSSLNGAVLKIRKIVPRLDFSSRAISVRSFPSAYSSMTRMCRYEIPFRFAFTFFRGRAFATGGMSELNNSECDLSIIFRQPATNDLERRVPQFYPIPTLQIFHIRRAPLLLKNLPSSHILQFGGLGSDPSPCLPPPTMLASRARNNLRPILVRPVRYPSARIIETESVCEPKFFAQYTRPTPITGFETL
jgi:hypothetical protein